MAQNSSIFVQISFISKNPPYFRIIAKNAPSSKLTILHLKDEVFIL